jgi:hypothetical protein
MHLVVAPADRDARFHRHLESGEVRGGNETAVGRVVARDRLRDRTAVEEIVCGAQLALAPAPSAALGLDHAGDAAREVLLHK